MKSDDWIDSHKRQILTIVWCWMMCWWCINIVWNDQHKQRARMIGLLYQVITINMLCMNMRIEWTHEIRSLHHVTWSRIISISHHNSIRYNTPQLLYRQISSKSNPSLSFERFCDARNAKNFFNHHVVTTITQAFNLRSGDLIDPWSLCSLQMISQIRQIIPVIT